MNEYDSALVRSILAPHGFQSCASAQDAEVILVNTCAVRENAYRKIYGLLDKLRPLKKQKKSFVVGVLGCMAQNLKEELLAHPVVSLVVGPDNYRSLPGLIEQSITSGDCGIDADLSEYETYSDIAPARVEGVNAWVAIMRGCDNFCTFCVVPYTRGRERSRSVADILDEVRAAAAAGFPQVTLLGQNVNSYSDRDGSFADLIVRVADVPAIRRVRFTSPHPKDFPDDLLEAIAAHPNICKHVHLPLQAGNDRILGLMGRNYTRREFVGLAERIRDRIPGVSLTTDIIVGFPTETEGEFLETFKVMENLAFDSAFIFKYSERKGTIASRKFADDVPPDSKTDRIVRLFDLQKRISSDKNRARIGSLEAVLIEGPAEKKPDHQVGKSDGGTTVIFPATPEAPGSFARVRIREASSTTLYGEAM